MALFGTIVDDFSSSSIAAHWDANYGTVTAIDGQARIGVDTSWQGLATSKSHTLVGSSLSAKITPPVAPQGATECYLAFMITGSTGGTRLVIDFNCVSGWIRFGSDTGYWDETSSSVLYDPAVHVYFRMRESGGTVYFETSANGTTWTIQSTEATPAWLTTEAQAVVFETHTNTGSTYAYVDNVNTELAAPSALSPATLHLKGAGGSWLTVTMRLLPWSEHVATTTTANFTESTEMIANPERGWYQYTETHWTDAAGAGYVPLDQTAAINRRTGTESIGGYTVPPRAIVFRYWVMEHMRGVDTLPQAFLDAVAADLAAARNAGVKIVGRFSYSNDGTTGANFDGNGPYNNDTTVDRTLGHVAQLKSVMSANKDVIHSLQAGFIGTWGEWYYTDYWGNKGTLTATDWNNRARLITALLDWGIDFVLLRYVGLKRRYLREASGTGWSAPRDAAARLGFHNDAFQASGDDADWGTFNTMADGMSVSEARAYLASETARPVPMLGETAGVSTRSGYTATKSSLAEHHWSALNPNYHADVLASWSSAEKDEVSRKLGYRLRLASAALPNGGMPGAVAEVVLNVVNDGWGAPLSPYTMQLVFTGASTVTRDLNVDLRKLGPGSHTITRRVALPDLEGTFDLHLAMPDRRLPNRPEYAVRLANTTAWANGRNNLGKSIEVAMPVVAPVVGYQQATVSVDPSVRSYQYTDIPNATATSSLKAPTRIVAGDLLVCMLMTDSGTLPAASTLYGSNGFIELGRRVSTQVRTSWAYKVATAADVGKATIPIGSIAAGPDGCAIIYSVKDWDGNTANLSFAMPGNVTGTTWVAPSVTPKTPRSLLMTFVSNNGNSGGKAWSFIPPVGAGAAGYTENAGGWNSGAGSSEIYVGTTATGTRTWKVNTNSTATLKMNASLTIPSGTVTKSITQMLAESFATGGSGGPLTNRIDVPFEDSTGLSSVYHIFAEGLDWSKKVGLMIYTDGSAEYGLQTSTINGNSEYLLDGPTGLIAVAKKHNMVLLTPRAPGDGCMDGDGVCWYDHSQNGVSPWQKLEWSNELIRKVLTEYNIDRRRIAIGGYSSGAQWTMSWWGPRYASEVMLDGVAIGISYGGQPRVSPNLTAAYKSNVEHVWDTGDADTAYSQPNWWDGVQTGRQWYIDNGFAKTDLVLTPGLGHDRYDTASSLETGHFGPIYDREITARVIPA